MKKIWAIITFAVILLTLTACGQSKSAAEAKTYDQDFMTSLEKGLDKRWEKADKIEDEDISKKQLKNLVDIELDEVKGYTDKKFKNSKLKENAIAYVNALKDTNKVLKIYGSNDFYTDWEEASDKRTAILVRINKIQKIKASDNNKDTLAELLGQGKSAESKNKFNDKVDALLKSVKYEAQPKDYPEDTWTTYKATVTNDTGYAIKSLSADIKLKNDAGTVVGTDYFQADNWLKGESQEFEFETDEAFTTYEIIPSYTEQGK